MTCPATPAPTDRFALIIDGLCQNLAASHARGVAGPLILLIWGRLRRIAARFAAVAARVRSGTCPAVRNRAAHGPDARSRAASGRPVSRMAASRERQTLPRGFGWVVRLVPGAACYGSQLQHLLSDAEMVALLSAAPQMGRILRPLCRMLAIELPPGLRPKPPGTPCSAARATAPGPEPLNIASPTNPPSPRCAVHLGARPTGIAFATPPAPA